MKPCLIWPKCKTTGGYGHRWLNGRMVYAHRAAWEEANGPIPAGMEVCHQCDVRACIEITHLFLGTHRDNMRDAKLKGRMRTPILREEKHPGAKLTRAQVEEIRTIVPLGFKNERRAAERYGVTRQNIRAILKGLTWLSGDEQ
jgi:Autographiviridae endonuclease